MRRPPRAGALALAAFLAGSVAARPQAAPARSVEPPIPRACAVLEAGMARTLAPGVAIAVSRNGRLLWSGVEGEPGTRFSYSSYGWNLLSAVIEGASGEPFLAFMEKRVFRPSGMTHTCADEVTPIVPGRSGFYTRDEAGAVVNAGYVDNSYKWAGGGFLSTAEDLVAFGNALLEGRLLKQETRALLWTSQKTSDGKDTEYGIGWTVDRDSRGRPRVRHSGGAQGGTANLVIYPAERLVLAMLVNSGESFTGRAPQIAEMFLDE